MSFIARLLRMFAVRGSRHVMSIRPTRDLEDLGGGRYRSLDTDPQAWLESDRGRSPRGWIVLRFEVKSASAHLCPLLRAVGGPDGSPLATIPLPVMAKGVVDALICLPYATTALRFDPTDRRCTFGLGSVEIREISPLGVLLRGMRRSPRGFLKALTKLPRTGYAEFKYNVSKLGQTSPSNYHVWAEYYDTRTTVDEEAIKAHSARLPLTPKISVVMPVWNTPETYLRAAIESVLAQLYPHWELCIADDASTKTHVGAVLREFAERDPRIKVVTLSENARIARASNAALAMATGDFIALLDHDDLLTNHALYMIAVEVNAHPDANILYSDEDKIDEDGVRSDPFFKPDWDPERFYAQNYINHLGVYRASVVKALAGFREGFEGSQDYDLALRVIAQSKPERIRHIPFVLYHWRIFPGAATFSPLPRGPATEAARRALRRHFANTGEAAEVVEGGIPFTHRIKRPLPAHPPRVSLIIPTRDRLDLLGPCVDGILHRTAYPDIEVIVVDNGSAEPETLRYFAEIGALPNVQVLRDDGPFNFSALNNAAARAATGTILGLINNDILVIEPGWLAEMVAQLIPQDVGAVGAKLYYGNDTIQHAGVVLGIGGVAGHLGKHVARRSWGYANQLGITRCVSAATGACLLIKRDVFDAVGGLDEADLAVAFNDIDLCIKIRAAGYRIVWTPYAELYHLESASRGYDTIDPEKRLRLEREERCMLRRWGTALEQDPYFNPNFALTSEDLVYAYPPRTSRPWIEGGDGPGKKATDPKSEWLSAP